MSSAGSTDMRATDEFHPGVENINKVGNLLEVAKRGGTAEVDAYRFRPHKELSFMERSDGYFCLKLF